MKNSQSKDEIKAVLRDLMTEVRKVRDTLEEIVKDPPEGGRDHPHRQPDRKSSARVHDAERKKERDR